MSSIIGVKFIYIAVYRSFFAMILISAIPIDSFASEGSREINIIQLTTGSVDGIYFPIGVSMCSILNENVEQYSLLCLIEASDGSIANYKKVVKSVNVIGMVQSDVKKFLDANPEILSAEERSVTPKALFSLHSEPVHIFVNRSKEIRRVKDLENVRVGLSKQTAGTSVVEIALLDFENIDRQNSNFVHNLRTSEKLSAFCAGEIDAFFYVAGISSAIALRAVKECEAEVMSVDNAFLDKFLSNHPEYIRIEIPPGVYNSGKEIVRTFGPTALLITSEDSDNLAIYDFTKYVLGKLNTLVNSHIALKELTIEKMARDGIILPLHSGAKEYLRESKVLP